ncbi:hypothetical protein Tco_0825292 [Tanacetum coccineum]
MRCVTVRRMLSYESNISPGTQPMWDLPRVSYKKKQRRMRSRSSIKKKEAKKAAKAKVDKEQATNKADKGKSVAETEESPKRFTRGDAKRQADKEDLNKESEEEDEDDVVHEGSNSEDEEIMDVKTKKATKRKNKKEALRSKGEKMKKAEENKDLK